MKSFIIASAFMTVLFALQADPASTSITWDGLTIAAVIGAACTLIGVMSKAWIDVMKARTEAREAAAKIALMLAAQARALAEVNAKTDDQTGKLDEMSGKADIIKASVDGITSGQTAKIEALEKQIAQLTTAMTSQAAMFTHAIVDKPATVTQPPASDDSVQSLAAETQVKAAAVQVRAAEAQIDASESQQKRNRDAQ